MKKINHIIKSLAIASAGVLSFCSCNDFLTIYPSDKTVGEEFWKTKDDVDQMVNGAYLQMISGGNIERFIMWGDYRSDELKKYSENNSAALDNISKVDLYPSSGYNSWSSFYNVVNTCNLVMKHAPEVMELDPDFTSGDYQTVKSQMLGLRALCHFYLVRTFRDIPYVTKAYENTDDMTLDGQISPDSTLTCCINDLEEAEKGCYKYGTFGYNDWRNVGLLSKDAINAILADVYLWRASLWTTKDAAKSKEYYQKCIEYADKVLQSRKAYYEANNIVSTKKAYYLYDGDEQFYYNFVQGNSRESIFELQFDGTNNSNVQVRNYYYKNGKVSETHGAVVGTANVGKALGDSPTPASSSASIGQLYQSLNDYRYFDNSFGVNDDNANSFEVRKMVVQGNMLSSIPTNKSGYMFGLNSRLFDNYRQNWIVYRLTDVMLMKAEAEIQLAGSTDKSLRHAFEIVQAVNKRSIVDKPDIQKTDTLVYSGNYNKQKNLELLCLQERGREFCYEGKRWYDLVRYSYRHMKGVDPTKTLYEIDPNGSYPLLTETDNEFRNIIASRYGSYYVKFKNEAYLYWPIYQSEIKNNPLIHQNPVYVETSSSERNNEE